VLHIQLLLLRWFEEFDFASQDKDAISVPIQNSTKGLKQGPVGHTLSSSEKRKSLVNTVCFDVV
jgi:hypothetical protein